MREAELRHDGNDVGVGTQPPHLLIKGNDSFLGDNSDIGPVICQISGKVCSYALQ